MAAYLCWLGVRLLEMHRILKPTGSIYLHCDSTAGHYIKLLMDAVFGADFFLNEITWKRTTAHNDPNRFGRIQDKLFFYGHPSQKTFNHPMGDHSEAQLRRYKYEDENGPFRAENLTAPHFSPTRTVEWRGVHPGADRQWRFSISALETLYAEGRILLQRDGRPRKDGYKMYLHESPGAALQDIWTDIELGPTAGERTGYPTQKPIALYERIISASSNPGDWVLDPFCGCATTPVAAEKLGRKWVGMDIWDKAYEVVLQRIADNRQLLADPDPQIHYTTTPPIRTDSGEPAVLELQTPTVRQRTRHVPPRQQHGRLLVDIGAICQGCGRDYSFDPRVLEVDHIRPRSDGGSDAYDNLILLCPPDNREKRDRMTLTGLQELNRRLGHLTPEGERHITHGRASRTARTRRSRS